MLAYTNKDNSKPFAEALKRSKTVFSVSKEGLTSCGSAASVLSSLEISKFANSLILHWGDPCQLMAQP